MFCPQCGTLVSANSKFCVACGSRVTGVDAGTLAIDGTDAERLLASLKRALSAEYDVERELGRGGMAVVYKAREIELDRPVALKVLPPELAPVGTVADRFKREARLAASLDHPNVIPVYRVGQAGGVMYMAMKFIDGRPLDAVMEAYGTLPLSVVLIVLQAAAAALAFAHEHGIVHRDIKGANILVDRDGRVVVSDFGIARAVESGTLTATGAMIGTPHFMSPEQCAGKPVGPQSDQYSLGVVAYQMLTGSVPFDGDSLPEILQHHWFSPVPDWTLMRSDTPAALTVAVLRMLEKAPERRFSSTNELLATIEAIRQTDADRAAGETLLRAMVRGTAPRPRGSGAQGRATPAAASAASAAAAPVATRVIEPPTPSRTPRPSAASSRISAGASAQPAPAATVAMAPAPQPMLVPQATPRPPAQPAPRAVRAPLPRPRVAPPRKKRPWIAIGGSLAAIVAVLVTLGMVRDARARVPRTAPAMRSVAEHEYRTGHYEMARRFYARAIALDSTDAAARHGMRCASAKLGRAATARDCD